MLENIPVPPKKKRLGRLTRLFQSLPFLGVIFFLFLTIFPPLEVETEINLPVHMAQHVLIALSGVLIAYPLYRAGKFSKISGMRVALFGFSVLCLIVILWHIPLLWDAAVLNPLVHVLEHLSFLIVGVFIGIFVPMLPDNFKMIALVMAISAHMFYGFSLYLINTPIYPVYPVSQQAILGIFMFAPSPVYFIGFLYITLAKESRNLETNALPSHPKRSSSGKWRMLVAAISLLLILVLSGYLSVTAVAIYAGPSPSSPNIPTIYILETPVTWQYAPQNITVVMGLNNTVEWISHSLTYDTVTSSTGVFSHSFSPGDSFEFTFTSPGVYDYYCLYHPWMRGTVNVIAS